MKENLKLGRFETAHGLIRKVKTVQMPVENAEEFAKHLHYTLQEQGDTISEGNRKCVVLAIQACNRERDTSKEMNLRKIVNSEPVEKPIELLEERLEILSSTRNNLEIGDPVMIDIVNRAIEITTTDILERRIKE